MNQLLKWIMPPAIVIILAMLLIPKCSNVPDPVFKPSMQILRKDSIHERVVYKDRWRTEVVYRYRHIKVDSLPCPEALSEVIVLTDSIITIDSSEISSLKAEVLIDNLIINSYKSKIISDSVVITKLSKKLRRSRRWNKILIVVSLGAIGVAVVR